MENIRREKIYFYTFGCKVNQYETENLRQQFQSLGYGMADSIKAADVCLVNTCTVTSSADSKALKLLRRIKKENPGCVLILTGCFPQAFTKEAESLTQCDIVTGSSDKRLIPSLLEEFLKYRKRIVRIAPHKKGEAFEKMENGEGSPKTRAYIKIQDGCDRYCSYCIIPFARGNIRSKPVAEIAAEAEKLSASGHKEIVLTGINICRYGADLAGGADLADAAEAAGALEGISRVRLGSIEPELITDSMIERLAANSKLCPHFHLSLQSGCDKTLKEMNRHYTTDEYYLLCQKLRERFPDCAITTDIMVGFPGETEEDFRQSLEFVKKVGFARAHIFPYSMREKTTAARRSDQISGSVKEARAVAMKQVCDKSEEEFLKSMVGKTVKVLFERENSPEFYNGYSENYTQIKIPRKNSEKSLRRTIFCVTIKEYEKNYCLGEISDDLWRSDA